MTDESKPKFIRELETLDSALGELKENGVEADEDVLEETADVLVNFHKRASENSEDFSRADEDFIEAIKIIENILYSDETEDGEGIEKLITVISTLGEEMQKVLYSRITS